MINHKNKNSRFGYRRKNQQEYIMRVILVSLTRYCKYWYTNIGSRSFEIFYQKFRIAFIVSIRKSKRKRVTPDLAQKHFTQYFLNNKEINK